MRMRATWCGSGKRVAASSCIHKQRSTAPACIGSRSRVLRANRKGLDKFNHSTAVLPARPDHPKDKAIVEGLIKIDPHALRASTNRWLERPHRQLRLSGDL